MVGHGGSSAGSYLADPTSPIPSHCVSIVVTSTLRVKASLAYGDWWAVSGSTGSVSIIGTAHVTPPGAGFVDIFIGQIHNENNDQVQ